MSTKAASTSLSADDVRCSCGKLLARWIDEGLELRCPRCKRKAVIPRGSLSTGKDIEVDLSSTGRSM